MRTVQAAVAVATVLGTLLAGTVAARAESAETAGQAPRTPDHFANQRIGWKLCFPGELPSGVPAGAERAECGTYAAPRDWNHPGDGHRITVAVSRLRPAHGTPRGTVLTNPGGPGAAGRMMSLSFLRLGRTKVVDNLEVVGIDVRGTGDSTRVSCGGYDWLGQVDPKDRRSDNVPRIYDAAAHQAERCQRQSGELGRYITTEQTVKDLDLLRHLLGREKISWIGYSGGTWLGAHYATYFPRRVDRFVLDSNADFTAGWQTSITGIAAAMERRFRADFLPWVAKYDKVYHLGTTGEQVRRNYERTRAELAAHPARLADGTEYTGTQFDLRLINGMYLKTAFPSAAADIATLRAVVDTPGRSATEEQSQTLAPGKAGLATDDAVAGTQFAILCNDTPWNRSRARLAGEGEGLGRAYPFAGHYQLGAPCTFWNRPAVRLKTPTGHGVPPVLMVQSEHDPATPLEGAQHAHRTFAHSRMITVYGEGDHTVYGRSNSCVNDMVENFLLDGKIPPRDVACTGTPLPDPTEPLGSSGATRAGDGALGLDRILR
ncbi:alpha/beta hydrolase [Amycolatopsis thailandensis]|uniref:alpha/beta hydrolase n=1 Tax=Amycolatopsis thailandensis TaxID=589330 RepID=UPI0037B41754